MRLARVAPVALAAVSTLAYANEVSAPGSVRVREPESEMVLVPGGVFQMGIDEAEKVLALTACIEEVGHENGELWCTQGFNFDDATTGYEPRRVYVPSFLIDRYEVTTREYRVCVRAGACDPRPLVSGDTRYIRDEWPVVNVTWYEARDYCAFAGKRLPTEAEWEKAARGTDGRRWPWGDLDAKDRANVGAVEPEIERVPFATGPIVTTVYEGDGAKILVPPGTFRFSKSPYGAYDMAGNVSEWVADWYSCDAYRELSGIDPEGPSLELFGHKVVRGGSFHEPRFYARTYYRNFQSPTLRAPWRGFRCARDIETHRGK